MSEPCSFDNVPYPSLTFPKTSPERLATRAAINGMMAADPSECSYLEVGCGDGTNLLAHAYMYPESEFLGIDLSQRHIDRANAAVAELGVQNAAFQRMNLLDVGEHDLDRFDYIVAHGVFSWVAESVRQRLLAIYSRHLAPHGVGYISYNTYPGCYVRSMMNEMMHYHTRGCLDPMEKVNSGVSILEFIGDVTNPESTYQLMIREELKGIFERSPENVLHDEFSEFNQPFYFYEFAEMLAANNMQYMSEADESVSNTGTLSPEAVQMLDTVSSNLIEREQYLDFIRCRRFRSTLFCREQIKLDRDHLRNNTEEFYIAGRLRPETDTFGIPTEEPETYFGPKNEKIQCDHPLTKAAIGYLSAHWAQSVRFDELIERSIDMFEVPTGSRSESDISRTTDFMIELFRIGLFRLRRYPDQGVAEVSAKPRVSRYARWQIERGSSTVMTLTGLILDAEEDVARLILRLADGTRDHNDLVGSMIENLEPTEDDLTQFRANAEETVTAKLETFAKNGLLEA